MERAAADRNSRDFQWHFASTVESHGALLQQIGRTREALDAYRQAAGLRVKLVGEFNLELDRWNLGCTYEALGFLLKYTGALDQAAEAYQDASAVWQKLVADFGKADHQNHLSFSQASWAGVLARRAIQLENDPRILPDDRKRQAQANRQKAKELLRDGVKQGLAAAKALNGSAWRLATDAKPENRDAAWAVGLAKKAVELAPKQGNIWNTLGVAHYRAGDWPAARTALQTSMEFRSGGDSFDWFFLAMALWELGDKNEARTWYDKAVGWMDRNDAKNEELRRFRAEAAELLKIDKK